ncbi:AraC family transcriptional regulator [Oscillospiraceae bacterium]|nr:AraC family transcriptional regulator [Oscillospiraceae bacterium]BDF73404.1 AraC family transcriptional regulator [Oscillospiraceae bacterium]
MKAVPELTTYELPIDESLRSTLPYGTDGFPFACYRDKLQDYREQLIGWHWHREFEFTYISSGTVEFRAGTVHSSLSAGDCLFINSNTIHSFSNQEQAELMHLIFSPEFIAPKDSLIFQKYVQPFLSADCDFITLNQACAPDEPICQRIAQIFLEMQKPDAAKELDISIQLQLLWKDLWVYAGTTLHPSEKPGKKAAQSRLRSMLDYIQAHYAERLSLEDIAHSANISKSEALRCFKTGLQITPVNYLNDYRLNRAAGLMMSTSKTVETVALDVGFQSDGYFCYAFRKKFGCSPSVYRKQNMLR